METHIFKCLNSQGCGKTTTYNIFDLENVLVCKHCYKLYEVRLWQGHSLFTAEYKPVTHELFIIPVLISSLIEKHLKQSFSEYVKPYGKNPQSTVSGWFELRHHFRESHLKKMLKDLKMTMKQFNELLTLVKTQLIRRKVRILKTWTHGGFSKRKMPIQVVYGEELKIIIDNIIKNNNLLQ